MELEEDHMSENKNEALDDTVNSTGRSHESIDRDPLDSAVELISRPVPPGVDRRKFLIRSAVVGAAAMMTGKSLLAAERTTEAVKSLPVFSSSRGLFLQLSSKGPIMITGDEFYKVGPGPSSSHTIGPMRITYDFYQRAAKLPADQLAQATALKVNLFGSLSATGKGHGTERAALAGLIGMEPATTDPAFLDGLAANPDQSFQVKFGDKSINVSLKDVVYDAPKGDF